MPDVIFARPRHSYDSYADLYHLITLSGYPLIYFDQIDPASYNCYILTIINGENNQGWSHPQARIIFWDLEWRLDGDYPQIPGVAKVWASDKWYAEKIGAVYVPLGSHVGLPTAPLEDCPKSYDVAMLSYMTHRRELLRDRLREMGISVASNGWGMDRHYSLMRSRVMLHVHQHDEIKTIAPQRWAIAAAYRLGIISEEVTDPGIFGYTHGVYATYPFLAETVKLWKDDARLIDYGLALHQALCVDANFKTFVERAL